MKYPSTKYLLFSILFVILACNLSKEERNMISSKETWSYQKISSVSSVENFADIRLAKSYFVLIPPSGSSFENRKIVSYSYSGEKLWEKEYKSKYLITDPSSDLFDIYYPITTVTEDYPGIWLHQLFDKNGELNSEYKLPGNNRVYISGNDLITFPANADSILNLTRGIILNLEVGGKGFYSRINDSLFSFIDYDMKNIFESKLDSVRDLNQNRRAEIERLEQKIRTEFIQKRDSLETIIENNLEILKLRDQYLNKKNSLDVEKKELSLRDRRNRNKFIKWVPVQPKLTLINTKSGKKDERFFNLPNNVTDHSLYGEFELKQSSYSNPYFTLETFRKTVFDTLTGNSERFNYLHTFDIRGNIVSEIELDEYPISFEYLNKTNLLVLLNPSRKLRLLNVKKGSTIWETSIPCSEGAKIKMLPNNSDQEKVSIFIDRSLKTECESFLTLSTKDGSNLNIPSSLSDSVNKTNLIGTLNSEYLLFFNKNFNEVEVYKYQEN